MSDVKPVLFSGPMIRALLDGRKTMTRRVIKPQPPKGEDGDDYIIRLNGPEWYEPAVVGKDGEIVPGKPIWGVYDDFGVFGARVPYMPGDLLWVKETFYAYGLWELRPNEAKGREEWHFDDRTINCGHTYQFEEPPNYRHRPRKAFVLDWWRRPSIFMPQIASRLTLEVTSVKVERLQEISEEDAFAEGITKVRDHCYVIRGFDYDLANLCHSSPVIPFAKLWDSLNAKRGFGWESNPWVIALTFKVHQINVDALLKQREAA